MQTNILLFPQEPIGVFSPEFMAAIHQMENSGVDYCVIRAEFLSGRWVLQEALFVKEPVYVSDTTQTWLFRSYQGDVLPCMTCLHAWQGNEFGGDLSVPSFMKRTMSKQQRAA